MAWYHILRGWGDERALSRSSTPFSLFLASSCLKPSSVIVNSGSHIRQLDPLTYVLDRPDGRGNYVSHLVAGLGARFLATLYDLVLEAILYAALVSLISWVNPLRLSSVLLGFMAVHVGYHLLFEVLTRGQSPGKNVVGLCVVGEQGHPPTLRQLLWRNLARIVDVLPVGYGLGGVVGLVWPPPRRIGDRVARTYVIYTEPLRELLWRVRCGPAFYSTSRDAYLLQSFILRADSIDPPTAQRIAEKLAVRLMRHYRFDEPDLVELFSRGQFYEFLEQLYLREHTAASAELGQREPQSGHE